MDQFAFYELGFQKLRVEALNSNLPSVGSMFQVGRMKVSQEYSEEFKDYLEYYVVRPEGYAKRREVLKKLVGRFADRQRK